MKIPVYLLTYTFVILVIFANQAQASTIRYQTPFEQAKWLFSGDKFHCEISHRVQGFGLLRLTAIPGEPLALSLHADWLELTNTNSQASVVPAAWHIQQSPFASTVMNWQDSTARSKDSIAPFLEGLEQGYSWQVNITANNGHQYQIDSSPVATQAIASQFRLCRQKLLPKPFDYVRRIELLFASSSSKLTPAHVKDLNAVYQYIQADSSIKEVLIDGHADASGNRLANLVLSKARADEVASRLIEFGIPPKMLQVRNHGTRAPVASNNNSQGRELNRRVTLRLVRSPTQSTPSSALGTE